MIFNSAATFFLTHIYRLKLLIVNQSYQDIAEVVNGYTEYLDRYLANERNRIKLVRHAEWYGFNQETRRLMDQVDSDFLTDDRILYH